MCPPNEWMRAANNDGDDDKEEEEVKGAEIQVSVLIQASVRINSFNLMTRLCVGVGGWGWVLPLFSPWSQQVYSQCSGVAAATGRRLDSFNTNSFTLNSGVRNL